MRRQLVVVSLGLSLVATAARADDHLARVNEVLLSHGGDATKQFVEIEDPANETFSAGGYGLFIYEADGSTQAHYQGLVIPSGAMRITVATANARTQFNLTPEGNAPNMVVNLAGDLPANGTACFRKSGVNLHCLTWGTGTPPAGPMNGQLSGPAPTDSMSVQRQATGNCAAVGAPTPNAVNAVIACGSMGVDAGPNPDGGTGPGTGPDGGAGSDGGIGESSDDGGCCSTTSSSKGLGFTVVAGMATLGQLLRRRRRR